MRSRVVIVAAMDREVRPLIRSWKLEGSADGVTVYSCEKAIAAFAGMGARRAELATTAALSIGPVHRIVSAGWAGGLHAGMSAGIVHHARAVVEAASGRIFYLEAGTDGYEGEEMAGPILVTAAHVASAAEKWSLHEQYSADLVDMEAAAVAKIAAARGTPFDAIKAVSDEHDFDLPAMKYFVTDGGQFRETAFALYVALRPGLWKPVTEMARTSAIAAQHLCDELQRYLDWDEEQPRA